MNPREVVSLDEVAEHPERAQRLDAAGVRVLGAKLGAVIAAALTVPRRGAASANDGLDSQNAGYGGSRSKMRSSERIPEEPTHWAEFLRPKDAAKYLGVSRSELYRMARRPGFPPKRHLGETMSGWMRQELLDWLHANAKPEPVKAAPAVGAVASKA